MTEQGLKTAAGTCTGRLVHTDPRGARVVELPDRPLDFGRGPEGVDHVLPGGRVSRRHFRLEPVPGDGHLLIDLGSANGTWVNDRRVASALLAPFDRVSCAASSRPTRSTARRRGR